MSRLYGDKKDLDSEKIKNFFNERAERDEESLLVITEFSEKENVERRHKEESELLINKIDFAGKKILEIGCGTGIWANFFHDKCKSYLGIDYSENLIEIAKENYSYDNCEFQILSATELDDAELLIEPPFDIIIITGVLLYFNDDAIETMINSINKLTNSEKIVYIRESVSFLDERLTLEDFYSDSLETEYNAVYRTEKEFLEFISKIEGINSIEKGIIWGELKKFEETGYQFFLCKS